MYTKQLLIALGLSLAVLAVTYIIIYRPFSSPPVIAQDLPADIMAAEEMFSERVRAEYGVYETPGDLMQRLREDGFRVRERFSMALYTKKALLCNHVWTVAWHADTEGGMTAVDGGYGVQCP